MKGKYCRKPHCRNGVVDMFGKDCLGFWIAVTYKLAWGPVCAL